MVRFTPLGGASEIGGSCAILEAFGLRLVVDAGVRPNARENKYPDFDKITRRGPVDAVLVTHAHADHTGALPILHRLIPDVPVFATPPTIRIARTLLRDSVTIMERDWEGDVDFSLEDVDSLVRAFVPVDYNTPTVVASTDTARATVNFVRAGHILGAAMLAIEFEDLSSGRIERVLMSGDISTFHQPTIPPADIEAVRGFRPSLFVCEGTYGTEIHNDMALEEAKFVERVAQVLERGGKVLIPAFAVGRAQNVVLLLRDAAETPAKYARRLGRPNFTFPKSMVVIDGMCRSIAEEYSAFRHLLQESLQDRDEHVFYDSTGFIRPVRNANERKDFTKMPGPMVFVSSSGMLTGGPSVAYARALAEDPKSAILLCGYQDEESPGRALMRLTRTREGAEYPETNLGGVQVQIRCEVDQYGLSAHSDSEGIRELFEAVQPLRLALVHGTPTRLADLQRKLEDYAKSVGMQVLIEVAHREETIEVDGTERFDEPAFTRATTVLPNWAQRVLTGRAAHGSSEMSASSAWVNASLLIGRERPLTDEEVARLDSLFEGRHLLGPDEVAMAREAMRLGQGLFWGHRRVGPEHMFMPTLPSMVECIECGAQYNEGDPAILAGDCPRCGSRRFSAPRKQEAALHHLIRMIQERVRLHRRGDEFGLAFHKERAGRMGVGVGDLVLFVTGMQDFIRLVPAVLREEKDDGFVAIAPGATDPFVSYSQIVARVGPWPSPMGMGLAPSPAEIRLLDALGRGVSALTVEYLLSSRQPDGGEGGIQDRGKALMSLWSQVPQGNVSPLAASLASVILVSWHPATIVQCTVEDLVDLLGGEAMVSPMMVVTALRELVERGLLQMRDVDGALQLQWTLSAQQTLQARSDTAMVFRALGPAFQRLLREAYQRSIIEIERLGILDEYRRRDPFVFSIDSHGRRQVASARRQLPSGSA